MITKDEFDDLVGAYALDAVDDADAAAVERYAAAHPDARAEIERLRAAAAWYATSETIDAPAPLRARLLATAKATTAPSPGLLAHIEAIEHLRTQIFESRSAGVLDTCTDNGLSVRELLVHLAAMESLVAADCGRPTQPELRGTDIEGRTAEAIAAHAESSIDDLLGEWDAAVAVNRRCAATEPEMHWVGLPMPSSTVMTIRAFETWIHAGDIERVLGRDRSPLSGASYRTMAELSMELVPGTMAARGVARDGAARIVLSGDGGGEWRVPLTPGAEVTDLTPVLCTIEAPIHEWCLRVADRIEPDAMPLRITGDVAVAHELVGACNAFATL